MKDHSNVSNVPNVPIIPPIPSYVVSVQINITDEQFSALWREIKPLIPVLVSWAVGGALLLIPMLTSPDNSAPVPTPIERSE